MSLATRLIEQLSSMNEAYPPEMKNLLALNRKAISAALNKLNIDIQNSNFNLTPISSGRAPILREPNRVYLIIYGNGHTGEVVVNDENGSIKALLNPKGFASKSWKDILSTGSKIYFIDRVSNADIQAARKAAKEGAIGLDRHENKQHRSSYDNTWSSMSRRGGRYYDKSGYMLDPYKYKNMLAEIKANDGGWKKDVEDAINEYESYLDVIKSEPRSRIGGAESRFRSGGSDHIRSVMTYIGDLAEMIDKCFSSAKKLDEVKNKEYDDPRTKEWRLEAAKDSLEKNIKDLKEVRIRTARKFENPNY